MKKPAPLPITVLFLIAILVAPSGTIIALQQDPEPAPISKTQKADIPEGLQAFVANVRKSVESGSMQTLTQHFSIEHLVESAIARGALTVESDTEKETLVNTFRDTINSAAENLFGFHIGDETRILSSTGRDDGTTELVFRLWMDDYDTCHLFRWRLVREDTTWKIIDTEDMNYSLSTSTLLVTGMEAYKKGETWGSDFRQLMNDFRNPNTTVDPDEELATLLELAEELLDQKIPDECTSFLRIVQVSCLLGLGEDLGAAEETVDILEKLDNPPAVTNYLRGDVLLAQERYKEAITAYEKYAAQFGWDANTYEMVADSWWGLGDREKATEFAMKGLEDDHRSWGCMMTLLVALPAMKKDEIDPWLEKNEFEEGLLEWVIDWSLENDDQEGSVHVFRLLKKHHPESALIEYYNDILDVTDF